ncbi:MAG: lysoplasmalogenase family protein [Sphingomonas sp.]
MTARSSLVLIAALAAGASFYLHHWIAVEGPVEVVWKGAGVGLLALWAALRARSGDGWLIATVLGLGAAGDMLLETHGMTIGALAFLAGHLVAVVLYRRNRVRSGWLVAPIAFGVAFAAWSLPADRDAAGGIAVYALGLGAMAGSALASRFPLAALGALLFVLSDLLIFAGMGPLAASPLPGLLIWPTYFVGQALIAWAVVTASARRRT